MSDFYFQDSIFNIVFTIVVIGVICVFGIIIFTAVKGISTWNHNNQQPKLTVRAKVTGKRTEVHGGSGDSSSRSYNYATFEVESGDRMELQVKAQQYAELAEDDSGSLSFQGTRFLHFERDR
ncbi:DUF2500 domain-containing protein [Bacillus capparidis]|uniref:Uncharacterized protein YxeA n=1 Tax=Bacillus capparidis TaxID=1840411 RepID=A0ABS4CZS0_9BACI|nr:MULTISPECIES: DUF2500 domain-containing protein [Bacillus]MBP1082861.1 uncharacterized protein YxeA [Bacillus capparidis]MED1098500.1 DUF2500 domain-containing protein [Bacillus capparidis]